MLAFALSLLLSSAPLKVSAADIVKAYAANEIGADAKYRDKPLSVTGQVFAVGKYKDGTYFVALFTPLRSGWVVQCQLATNDPKAGDVVTGSTMTVQGTGGGLRRMGGEFSVVVLHDCAL